MCKGYTQCGFMLRIIRWIINPLRLNKKFYRFKNNSECGNNIYESPTRLSSERQFVIHAYVYNWPLQPFSQDYGLASHTTHFVCVNFIREKRDLQYNVDSEQQIFEKIFHCRFIYSQSFCQKSAERKSPKKYFFCFICIQCRTKDS